MSALHLGQKSLESDAIVMQDSQEGSQGKDRVSRRKFASKFASSKDSRRQSFNSTGISGPSFTRQTNRLLSNMDESLGVKGPNVFNGNKALRGLSLNENRFENINKTPEVSSNVKYLHLPKWDLNSDRHIDFRNTVYNRNVYKPKTT